MLITSYQSLAYLMKTTSSSQNKYFFYHFSSAKWKHQSNSLKMFPQLSTEKYTQSDEFNIAARTDKHIKFNFKAIIWISHIYTMFYIIWKEVDCSRLINIFFVILLHSKIYIGDEIHRLGCVYTLYIHCWNNLYVKRGLWVFLSINQLM